MTIVLLVLLVVVVVGALVWRSERRRRAIHPGTGFGARTSARGYAGSDTDSGTHG